MTKLTTTHTVKTEVKISAKTQRKLLNELRSYGSLAEEQKALKSSMDEHRNTVLEVALAEVEAEKFEIEGYKVAVVKGAKDRRLDKIKLIKRLVKDGHYSTISAEAMIEDCTTEKPKKDYCKITVPGESEE